MATSAGISLSPELVNVLDLLIKKGVYKSRHAAMSDAISMLADRHNIVLLDRADIQKELSSIRIKSEELFNEIRKEDENVC